MLTRAAGTAGTGQGLSEDEGAELARLRRENAELCDGARSLNLDIGREYG